MARAHVAAIFAWLVIVASTLIQVSAAETSVDARVSTATRLEDSGDYAGAKAALAPALDELEKAGRRVDLANAEGQFGWLEYRLGALESAETHVRRAIALFSSEPGTQQLDVGLVMDMLGVILRDRSQYDAAERAFDAALVIANAKADAEHSNLRALVHNNVAGLWYYRSDYRKAIEHYQEARRIFVALKGEHIRNVANVTHNIGQMYEELGARDDARNWYDRALALKLELFGPDHPMVASTLTNLGSIATARGDTDEARRLYQRALKIYLQVSQANPNVAHVEYFLGILDRRTGNLQQARQHLERSLAIREQVIGADSTWVAESLSELGETYQALGRAADARAALQRSLLIASGAAESELHARSYGAYARVLAAQGRREPAVFYGKLAVNVLQEMRASVGALGHPIERSFLAVREPVYRDVADWLITLGRLPEAQQVLDMLKEEEYADFVRTQSAEQDYGRTRAEFTARERALDEELSAAAGAFKSSPIAANRAKALAVMAMADSRLRERSQVPVETTARAARSRPDAAVAIVRYVVMPDRVRMLVTSGNREWQRDVNLTAVALNRQVFHLREQLQDRRSDPRAAARELYASLIEPIAAGLATDKVRRLVLVEDGTLRYVPFAALFDGQRYLIETYELQVATPAVRDRPGGGATPVPNRVAAFGVTEAGLGLGPLARVAIELDRIVKADASDRFGVVPGIVALDEAFSAARLRSALTAGFPAVHIASHFVFRPGTVSDSYLLLGGGDRLTLAELSSTRYPLRDVGLLTLSACQTAVGQPDADGREFESFGVLAQRQGAHAVLATLWSVADLSTATFMARFYREHQTQPPNTSDTPAALRRAQLTFVQADGGKSAFAIYRHPFYWAPYIVMGSLR